MTLGQFLRSAREAKDLPLRQLARRLQVSPAHLSDIELGRRYPSARLRVKLARALAVSETELRLLDTRAIDEATALLRFHGFVVTR